MMNQIPVNEKLTSKTLEELARLYHERMQHNYLTVPEMVYIYPNSYEGDCLRIAHEISRRILEDS